MGCYIRSGSIVNNLPLFVFHNLNPNVLGATVAIACSQACVKLLWDCLANFSNTRICRDLLFKAKAQLVKTVSISILLKSKDQCSVPKTENPSEIFGWAHEV